MIGVVCEELMWPPSSCRVDFNNPPLGPCVVGAHAEQEPAYVLTSSDTLPFRTETQSTLAALGLIACPCDGGLRSPLVPHAELDLLLSCLTRGIAAKIGSPTNLGQHAIKLRAACGVVEKWFEFVTNALHLHFVESICRATVRYYELNISPFYNRISLLKTEVGIDDTIKQDLGMWQSCIRDIQWTESQRIYVCLKSRLNFHSGADECVTCMTCASLSPLYSGDSPLALVTPDTCGSQCFAYAMIGIVLDLFPPILARICKPVALCDLGDSACPVLATNDEFCRLTQTSQGDWCGRDIVFFKASVRLEVWENTNNAAVAVSMPPFCQARFISKTGTIEGFATLVKLVIRDRPFCMLVLESPQDMKADSLRCEMIAIAVAKVLLAHLFYATGEVCRDSAATSHLFVAGESFGYIDTGPQSSLRCLRQSPSSRISAFPPAHKNSKKSRGKRSVREGHVHCDFRSGHPDKCTPCSFFCYSRTGCSEGLNCSYCHEARDHLSRRLEKRLRHRDQVEREKRGVKARAMRIKI